MQVGTLFAYCEESGLTPELKRAVLEALPRNAVRLRTDPRASPTRYPFKLVSVDGLAQQDDTRVRNCDLGYLRMAYRRPDGRLGYRCAAEPVDEYVAKGGNVDDTVDRRCLCNGLTANVSFAQARDDETELPLLTSGDELVSLTSFARGRTTYTATDVVSFLLA